MSIISGGIHIEHFDRKLLWRISVLGRVVGVATIIYGGWLAFNGLYVYLIGAVPGIISIIAGSFLFKSGLAAKKILHNKNLRTRNTNDFLRYYGYFLSIVAGLFIVAIIFLSYFFIEIWI